MGRPNIMRSILGAAGGAAFGAGGPITFAGLIATLSLFGTTFGDGTNFLIISALIMPIFAGFGWLWGQKALGRPGFTRAIFGLFLGMWTGVILLGVARIVLNIAGLVKFDDVPLLIPSTGSAMILAGFGGAFGWLWGIGSFGQYSKEHSGMDLALADETPTAVDVVVDGVSKATPDIVQVTRPLLQPLGVVLGIVVGTLVLFFVLGVLGQAIGFTRIQTDNPAGSAAEIGGNVPIAEQVEVPKIAIFGGFVLVSLGLIGGLAMLLALGMNGLTKEVETAKKEKAQPATGNSVFFRLIDFFLGWARDIFEGTNRTVNR